jgi:hypothetical protein
MEVFLVLHRVQELGRLCRNVGMSTAHNRKLCAAVLVVQRAAEITADTPTAPHEQPQAAPKDLKSVQIADWLATVRPCAVPLDSCVRIVRSRRLPCLLRQRIVSDVSDTGFRRYIWVGC